MARLYVNNFITSLASAITSASATSIDITDATGLPTLSGGDTCRLTIDDGSNVEIVEVTAISSPTGASTLTVVRGVENSGANTFANGTLIEMRATADSFISGGGSGSLSFITSSTASASADLTFTGLGNYSYIEFILNDIIPATNATKLHIQTSTNNGSSYDSGATDYSWASNGYTTGGSTGATYNDGDSKIVLTGTQNAGNASGRNVCGTIKLFNPTGTNFRILSHHLTWITDQGYFATQTGGGARKTSADVDAIRFFFSSGNITSGTIYVYGISKT